jgi:DNA-binding transcriptional ArsR family regulator
MKTDDLILRYLEKYKSVSGTEIARHLGISRQAVNKHLKQLVKQEMVRKAGTTKAAKYSPAYGKSMKTGLNKISKIYQLSDLSEDSVFLELDKLLRLEKNLRSNVFGIIRYTFTEMLNNAIDHSGSDRCLVEIRLGTYTIEIRIRDYGIGVYFSISRKFRLRDEFEAAGELLKGKTTTMKEQHSGEGIFFTSKAVDIASFRSHRLKLTFDNTRRDIFVEQDRFIKGTEVILQTAINSRRDLTEIFRHFAPEEYSYSFQRTRVHVRLYLHDFVSRSEARRILVGLDRFSEIILDFKDVRKIGQGFADEIFRVFPARHPDIVIKTENTAPVIRQMIKHVVDNKL